MDGKTDKRLSSVEQALGVREPGRELVKVWRHEGGETRCVWEWREADYVPPGNVIVIHEQHDDKAIGEVFARLTVAELDLVGLVLERIDAGQAPDVLEAEAMAKVMTRVAQEPGLSERAREEARMIAVELSSFVEYARSEDSGQ